MLDEKFWSKVKMRQKRAETGVGYKALGAEYGVGYAVTRRICLGEVWRHV